MPDDPTIPTDGQFKSMVVTFTSEELDLLADAAGDLARVPGFVREAALEAALRRDAEDPEDSRGDAYEPEPETKDDEREE